MQKKIIFKLSENTLNEYTQIIKKADDTIRKNEEIIRKYNKLISAGINGRICVYCIESENYYDIVAEQFSRHNIETFRFNFDDLKEYSKNKNEKPWDILLILIDHNMLTCDIVVTINKLLVDTNLCIDSNGHHNVKIMLTEYAAKNDMCIKWNELMNAQFDQLCMYDINFLDNIRHLAKIVHYMNRGCMDMDTILIESNLKPKVDHFSKYKKPDDKCRIKRLGIYYIESDNNTESNDNNFQEKDDLQYEDYFYSIVQQLAPHDIKVLRYSYDDLVDKDMSKTKNEMIIFLVDHNMPSCEIAARINKLLMDTNLKIYNLGNLVKIMLTGIVNEDKDNVIFDKHNQLIEAYIKDFCTSDIYLFNHVLVFPVTQLHNYD